MSREQTRVTGKFSRKDRKERVIENRMCVYLPLLSSGNRADIFIEAWGPQQCHLAAEVTNSDTEVWLIAFFTFSQKQPVIISAR